MKLAHGLAFGRSLWTRHRWQICMVAACVAPIVMVSVVLYRLGYTMEAMFAGLGPLVAITATLMNALLYCEEAGNLESGYLRRAFALPMSTGELVAWPMLAGALVMVLSWAIAARLIMVGVGWSVPMLAPTLGLIALMAWFQALSWAPIANSLVRIVVLLTLIAVMVEAPAWLLWTRRLDPSAAFLFPLAYLVAAVALAMLAVGSARRGESWRVIPRSALLSRFPSLRIPRFGRFSSRGSAQTWFDWRCHGLIMPGFMALIVAAMFVPSLIGIRNHSRDPFLLQIIALIFLGAPTYVAESFGGTLARMCPLWIKDRNALSFVAIRPTTSHEIVTAKFRMVAWSVLLSCVIMFVGGVAWIFVSGQSDSAAELIRRFWIQYPGWRGFAVSGLTAILLPILIWKQATDQLPFGLTGRKWLSESISYVMVVLTISLVWLVFWLQSHPTYVSRLFAVIPWLVSLGLIVKLIAAAWAFRECRLRDLIEARDEFIIFAAWAVLSLCALALVFLLVPSEGFWISRTFAGLAAISFVPLGRFPLSVLALEWNRHR